MPHYFDFSAFNESDISEIELRNLDGWINPLTVEYVFANLSGKTLLYWRIKGTAHTFSISSREFNVLSNGDYESHFKEVLKKFKDDLKEWYSEGLPHEWQREYLYMYKNFIRI